LVPLEDVPLHLPAVAAALADVKADKESDGEEA
jgi:hypothetical protein